MNSSKMMMTGAMAILVAGIAACGGSSSNNSDSGSVARLVTGPITAFGSVYVNGKRYNTDNARVYVEGGEGSESDLRVGMMVKVETSADDQAKSIHFSDDLEGVVDSTNIDPDGTGTMVVMGQTVTLDVDTVFESNNVGDIVTAADIAAGNIVEVSGYSTGPGAITATRIEVKALDLNTYLKHHSEGVELKGVVAGHDETNTFSIGSQVVYYDETTVLDDMPAGNWDGLYVEVKSTQGLNDQGQLVASKVELENEGSKDHHGDENDELEAYGAVSAVTETSVTINDQVFLLNDGTRYEHGSKADLVEGVMVKVEAYVNADGDLVAKEVKFNEHEDADEHEIRGPVTIVEKSDTDVNVGKIEVGGKTILVNNDTIMHDSGKGDTHFNLSALMDGDFVEVHVVLNDDGVTYTAIKLERGSESKNEDSKM